MLRILTTPSPSPSLQHEHGRRAPSRQRLPTGKTNVSGRHVPIGERIDFLVGTADDLILSQYSTVKTPFFVASLGSVRPAVRMTPEVSSSPPAKSWRSTRILV